MGTDEPRTPAGEPSTPTVPTKVCPHCGTQSQTAADKCPNCGKSYKVKRSKGGGCLRIIGGIVLLIIVIAVIASLATKGGDKGTVKKGNKGTNTSQSTAGVGDTLTLKGTAYKVTKVRTAKTVGSSFTKETADGRFVIVNLVLTNLKKDPRTILADAVRIKGGNGSEYDTSDKALLAFKNQLTILQEIQPGLPKKLVDVYDIPASAVKGAKLQVKDLF